MVKEFGIGRLGLTLGFREPLKSATVLIEGIQMKHMRIVYCLEHLLTQSVYLVTRVVGLMIDKQVQGPQYPGLHNVLSVVKLCSR